MLMPVTPGHRGVGNVHLFGVRRPRATRLCLGRHDCRMDVWVMRCKRQRVGWRLGQRLFYMEGPPGTNVGGSEGLDRPTDMGKLDLRRITNHRRNHKIPRFENTQETEDDQCCISLKFLNLRQWRDVVVPTMLGPTPTLCGLRPQVCEISRAARLKRNSAEYGILIIIVVVSIHK